jgi:hypothetical protein
MELDNFIIGKNRGEERIVDREDRRVGQNKAPASCQKNRAPGAKHSVGTNTIGVPTFNEE